MKLIKVEDEDFFYGCCTGVSLLLALLMPMVPFALADFYRVEPDMRSVVVLILITFPLFMYFLYKMMTIFGEQREEFIHFLLTPTILPLPEPEEEQSCRKCKYYCGTHKECLRHAPVVVVSESWNTDCAFPRTSDYHWCGDFERKKE